MLSCAGFQFSLGLYGGLSQIATGLDGQGRELKFPKLEPETDHLLHLDALRLIGSLGVVAVHLLREMELGTWTKPVTTGMHSFALFVDMFFAISGFVIAFVYFERITGTASYGSFMQKRLARLAPLHWATLAMFASIGLLAQAFHIVLNYPSAFDLNCLPIHFLFLHATGLCPHQSFNGPSWSISAEMFMYVATPLFFLIMRRSLILICVATLLVWLALTLITHGAWLTWMTSGGVIRAVPSFMLGVCLFGLRKPLGAIPFADVFFWLSVSAFLVGCALSVDMIALLLASYLMIIFGIAADARQKPSRFVRVMAAGGQLTYSSYMLHQLVILIVLTAGADHLLHLHGLAKNLTVLFVFAIIWPLSYLSLVLFEKPARRWVGAIRI